MAVCVRVVALFCLLFPYNVLNHRVLKRIHGQPSTNPSATFTLIFLDRKVKFHYKRALRECHPYTKENNAQKTRQKTIYTSMSVQKPYEVQKLVEREVNNNQAP